MMKRLFALTLCLLLLLPCFAGCSFKLEEKKEEILTPEEEELLKGAQINMYISEMIYDFDPANAYNNEAALKLISLIYEPLFYLDQKGKLKSNLVDKYVIEEDDEKGEYKLSLYLAETYWSDGTYISANDVVFSWKRLLEAEASYAAAALLFDIKNAREANQGDTSIDNIGLSAPNDKLVEVFFNEPINYDQFLLNLTSYALAPLRENLATKTSFYKVPIGIDPTTNEMVYKIVRRYDDWAKKGATMAGSGPFKVRTVKYPDDPVKDSDGNYLLNENGEFLYCFYVQDAVDERAVVKMEKGTYYYVDANGQTFAYNPEYLRGLNDPNKPDKMKEYNEIITSCEVVRGVVSDYATSPQNSPQIILERNSYYFKDVNDDNWKVDEVVIPYKLIIDYSLTDAEIMEAYKNGEIFYVGDIPLSLRSEYKNTASITDGLSTHSYYLNENAISYYSWIDFNEDGTPKLFDEAGTQYRFDAETGALVSVDEDNKPIKYKHELDEDGKIVYHTEDGTKVYTGENGLPVLGENILSNVNVRQALSLAIDRTAIADAVVFAEAAGALVPTGVFNTNSAKKTFRENGADYLAKTADNTAALAKLTEANIDSSKYSLTLSYAAYDEVHEMIATTVAGMWESLGFKVRLEPLRTFDNTDTWTSTDLVLSEVKDDLWLETLIAGDYEIMAMDMVAYSADPFSVLAPFAKLFSGMGMDMQNFDEYGEPQYNPATHITGFDDETYNQMMEDIYAESDLNKRAELLHKAEEYLMGQMPVIPIIYNQNATLVNDDMLTDHKGNYYAPAGFVDCYLKGTPQYQTHVTKIWVTIAIVSGVVIVLAAVVFFVVTYRIKAKKREEEIARISAEHEAKLREIRRPGSRS